MKLTISKIESLVSKARKAHDRKYKGKKNREGFPYKFGGGIEEYSSLAWQPRNKQFKGCNGKCTFDPIAVEAFSYKHWQFVRVIRGKVVFNNYRYSHTTNSHQYSVVCVMRSLGIKIDLEVNMYKSLSGFESHALEPMYRRLIGLEIAIARKGSKPKLNAGRQEEIELIRKDISLARDLGAKFSADKIKDLRAKMHADELKRLESSKGQRQVDSELAKRAREVLRNSFSASALKSKPQTVSKVYRLKPSDRKNPAKQALAAFLNTDTTRARFKNYFIDGNQLVYRVMVHRSEHLNKSTVAELISGLENKTVACSGELSLPELVALRISGENDYSKSATYKVLQENVIATKELMPDGSVKVVANADTLPLIGRKVAFGNERDNRLETEIQKELKELADSYLGFRSK
jgi:hypothetical protein